MPRDGLLRLARNDGICASARGHTGTLRNFFVSSVDRIFTTFVERPFTNVFDANGEISVNP
jgi:hypothetical protein